MNKEEQSCLPKQNVMGACTYKDLEKYKKLSEALKSVDPSYIDNWEVAETMDNLIDSVEFLLDMMNKFKEAMKKDLGKLPEE